MMVFDEVHGHYRMVDHSRSKKMGNFTKADQNLKQSMTKKDLNRTDQRKENY